MGRIVVVGGSVIGSAVALLLARDGHDVTVLERDATEPPDSPAEAWDQWDRGGVPQFRQPHNVFPRVRLVVEAELPDVLPRMAKAGLRQWDYLQLPPSITDRDPRPGDERFWCYTGRRPVVEAVFAETAAEEPNVEVRRGTSVAGLVTSAPAIDGVPHVSGVRLDSGEEVHADLVVDAMGRRSQLSEWLEAAGARRPYEESEDSGFTYYTRYYRGAELPPMRARGLSHAGTFSILTLAGDNETWSVTLFSASNDRPLKQLRFVEKFDNVVRACPLHAHWLDGEAITDVLPMSGVLDKYRRFVVDGRPVATGVAAVGDAWACTNPSAGRGISVGFVHAQRLRDVVRSSLGDPSGFAAEWDAATETYVAPFYRNQIKADRARVAEMDALRDGQEPPAPDPISAATATAMAYDADVFRAGIEMLTCLALPEEVFARPGMIENVLAAAAGREPIPTPAPARAELLRLVS